MLSLCLYQMFVWLAFDFWSDHEFSVNAGGSGWGWPCWALLAAAGVTGVLGTQELWIASYPCFLAFSLSPDFQHSVYFPYMTIQNMLAIKTQWNTISNTLLQLKCVVFLFIFQLCNAVRRVDQVSPERFLLLKLFIACHYTACLILEIFFFFPLLQFSPNGVSPAEINIWVCCPKGCCWK